MAIVSIGVNINSKIQGNFGGGVKVGIINLMFQEIKNEGSNIFRVSNVREFKWDMGNGLKNV